MKVICRKPKQPDKERSQEGQRDELTDENDNEDKDNLIKDKTLIFARKFHKLYCI